MVKCDNGCRDGVEGRVRQSQDSEGDFSEGKGSEVTSISSISTFPTIGVVLMFEPPSADMHMVSSWPVSVVKQEEELASIGKERSCPEAVPDF